jgi:putative sterol carrier protein
MPQFTSVTQAIEAQQGTVGPEKLAGIDEIVLFDLSGEGGEQWTVTIANGQLSVAEGTEATPTVTLKLAAADLTALLNGDLSPMAAFMQGRLKVGGDVSAAMRLQTLFG